MDIIKRNFKGIILTIIIAIIGQFFSQYIPIGAVAIAIIIGMIIGNTVKLGETYKPGITFSEKTILSIAIALLGVKLNFTLLGHLGYKSIFFVILAQIFTIFTAMAIGKALKLKRKFALLIGIGNAVCGSSAIAATEQIVGGDEEEVGLSIAVVNFLGTIGLFLVPILAKLTLHFTDINSGILIGNTLQAVGQVVAGGASISDDALASATIIKMSRILMLLPMVFILMFLNKEERNSDKNNSTKKATVPTFIIGFVLFSFIPTFNLLPENIIHIIGKISHYLLVTAMAGIGLKIEFSFILKDGKLALLVGGITFLLQIIFSTIFIILFYK